MTLEAPPRVDETHVSWVFQAGDRAYKRLKPVRMPFLDHTDPARRIEAIAREFELNRRIAPDVYLGTADVVEDGVVTDRLLVMKRLPADRRLAALAGSAEFTGCLRQVARTVAAFHAGQRPIDPAPMATADALLGNWTDNIAITSQLERTGISRDELDRVRFLAFEYVRGRRSLLDRRIVQGFVRDGHGDLIADDVFCLDDGPRIIDCLAFNDDWRIGDVLLDIAFLVMDVHRLAGPQAARQLMAWYQEFSGEQHPSSLSHHYVAYRAHVRAKVAGLRWQQGDAASADLARAYHDLARHHLEHSRVRLVMVGGIPGAGKTVLATGLAERLGSTVLSTDEIRHDMAGLGSGDHRPAAPDEGAYTTDAREAIYREQLREARALLGNGESVVLDATWTHERHRVLARELAVEAYAGLVEIECRVAPEVAERRIAARSRDPSNLSDATDEVLAHLLATRDPWPSALGIDTSDDADRALDHATHCVDTSR